MEFIKEYPAEYALPSGVACVILSFIGGVLVGLSPFIHHSRSVRAIMNAVLAEIEALRRSLTPPACTEETDQGESIAPLPAAGEAGPEMPLQNPQAVINDQDREPTKMCASRLRETKWPNPGEYIRHPLDEH